MVVSSRLLRRDRLVAGVEQREAAGAVGRLHHAGREAALPDGRRLLVAGDAEDADRPAEQLGSVVPNSPAQSRTSGSSDARHAEQLAAAPRPSAPSRMSNSSVRDGVGGVGGVHLAAGQPPEQEAVDGAEGEPPGLAPPRARRRRGRAARRSWWRRNTDRAAARSCAAIAGSWPAARSAAQASRGAAVLPDDGVVDRPAGRAVPHDRGLALVGDAERGDVRARSAPALRQRVAHGRDASSTRSPPDRARPSPGAG